MSEDKAQKYCRGCGTNVLVIRKGTNHVLHFLLSVCTLGLWLFVWFGASIKFGGWRCTRCGGKRLTGAMRIAA